MKAHPGTHVLDESYEDREQSSLGAGTLRSKLYTLPLLPTHLQVQNQILEKRSVVKQMGERAPTSPHQISHRHKFSQIARRACISFGQHTKGNADPFFYLRHIYIETVLDRGCECDNALLRNTTMHGKSRNVCNNVLL